MTLFYIESLKIFFYLLFSGVLSLIIILLSYSFSISNPYVEKISAYECGFDPYEDSRNAFDVRFYLIAILFIVFDLETCYFFPWCTSLSLLGENGFFGMLDFTLELLIGYIYAWETGCLNWD